MLLDGSRMPHRTSDCIVTDQFISYMRERTENVFAKPASWAYEMAIQF